MASQPELPDAERLAQVLQPKAEQSKESERARLVPTASAQQRLAVQQAEQQQREQRVRLAWESELPRVAGRRAWQRLAQVQPESQVQARWAQ